MARRKGINNKVERVGFRLASGDKLYYTSIAKKLGYSLSEFILLRLADTPIINQEMERYKWDAVKGLSKELNAIGHNINQLTKEVHLIGKGALPYTGQYEQLKAALETYTASKNQFIDLLTKEVL